MTTFTMSPTARMKYWNFLDNLRQSGTINMFGAIPYLTKVFPELDKNTAREVLADWMGNYGN